MRIELDGVVLAGSGATVMVFETGLPTRYYLDRSAVNFEHLEATETVTSCPYNEKVDVVIDGEDLPRPKTARELGATISRGFVDADSPKSSLGG